MKRLLVFTACAGIAAVALVAQNRLSFPIVSQENGHVALGIALRKLNVTGTFMQAPAHPDDETNSVLAHEGLGQGLRVIDVQNNRGDGGQNEIGPELFRDIAVLRTSELLSAHRIDGAEQYFTRAIDYGYSFSPEESIEKWGQKEIVGDYVRFIRTFRPDVLLTMNIQGGGGDRAHESTTILVREAYQASGNPAMYPEQLAEGLHAWQPKKLYSPSGRGAIPATAQGRGGPGAGQPDALPAGTKICRVDVNAYDALLGRTWNDIGTDARTNHRCQGMSGLPPLPGIAGGRGGPGAGSYVITASSNPSYMGKDETSLFDGIDVSLGSLAQYAGANPPAALVSGLDAIAAEAKKAQAAYAGGNDAGTAGPTEAGLTALRALRAGLAGMGLSDAAKYEIDFRLKNEEKDFENAVLSAHGVSFDAVSDDGLVVGGQGVKVSLVAVNRGASDITVSHVAISGFEGAGECKADTIKKDGAFTCTVDAKIPANAKATTPYFSDDYWKHPANHAIQKYEAGVEFGVPFAPSPYRVMFHVKAGTVDVHRELPVQFRYVKDVYHGDKRMEINVVPAFSVRATPPLAVVPMSAGANKAVQREIRVAVTNGTKGAANVSVALDLPAGWKATPASVPVSFEHEDESLSAKFVVTAPAGAKVGNYTITATVTADGRKYADGYQEIEYPHIQRRQVIKPAEVAVKVIDVKTTSNLNVGYIVGVGDQVPPALEQLGAKVSMIEPDELAGGDLSKYLVIITGVRAYERRTDLRAYNKRLIDYADRGGTVIVQYNKFEFNQGAYGPYPVKVSSSRVSDETVPVKILAPNHPVFNYPNKIADGTWANWTQERGLYFLGEKDSKYVDLVSMTDSYKDNPGEKLGSFVEGRVGRGRWIYLGLGLWRQLPAGTEGAYQLLANLISLSGEKKP